MAGMRSPIRKVAVWAAMWCLLAGLAMPLWAKSEPYDPDANDGLPIAAAQTTKVQTATPAPPIGHCLICHWWSAMSTVTPSAPVAIVRPLSEQRSEFVEAVAHPTRLSADLPSPRGPPAVV
jgi:hypothetical protein